eukprot:4211228-Amphidinium_carterae.2
MANSTCLSGWGLLAPWQLDPCVCQRPCKCAYAVSVLPVSVARVILTCAPGGPRCMCLSLSLSGWRFAPLVPVYGAIMGCGPWHYAFQG